MISTTENRSALWRLWLALIAILVAVWATLLLTRPAAKTMSMTPLSGLMTLKSLAAEAVSYEAALANQKPTFIEFYADWCTTCQSTAPTIQNLHQQYSEQINFVMLDIDNPKWASQIAQYKASGVPQFTLIAADQAPINTWVGKVPKPIFTETFERLLVEKP